MALVEIVATNLHAGADLRKLEVGSVVDVDDATAERWLQTGKAKKTDQKKGEKLSFEVATPSAPTAALTGLQKQHSAALAQIDKLTADAEAKDKSHADALAAEKKRAEEAEAALEELKKKVK
ncbi:hypothetical protein [Kosakonia cowanii]|jgi:hypothetical protein|uniref:hypothetical protein n=1 Tax=Kosakonia cowanii TaxID=208223 RepID=UPI0030760373